MIRICMSFSGGPACLFNKPSLRCPWGGTGSAAYRRRKQIRQKRPAYLRRQPSSIRQRKAQGQAYEAAEFHRYKRLISQTALFPLDAGLYPAPEAAAVRWRENGHTKPHLSFAQLAREDPLLALQCFPQTKGTRKNNWSNGKMRCVLR